MKSSLSLSQPRAASSGTNRSRREVSRPSGGFAVSASRVMAASAAGAFAAWSDPRRRARWLAGVQLAVRRAWAWLKETLGFGAKQRAPAATG